MVEALAIAVFSVAFGALLGLWDALGKRVLGAIQTFGFAAAIGLVLLQLLPEAFVRLGWVALVLFLVASRVPAWLETFAHRALHAGSGRAVGLDLAYAGFAIHQIADGVSMGTFTGGTHAHHDHGDYFLATAGHTIPLTALLVGMIAASRGKRAALWRAIGLAIAVALGIALPSLVDTRVLAHADAWIGAIAAGLLFHAVGHAHADESTPVAATGLLGKTLDLAAAALGFGLALVAEHGAGGDDHVHVDPMHTISDAVTITAPAATVALVLLLAFARRRGAHLRQAAVQSAGRVLPWFVIATLVTSALLSVSERAFVQHVPAVALHVIHAVAMALGLASGALMLTMGTRTFLLRPLSFLNAHSHHHDHHHHHDHAHDHHHGHAHTTDAERDARAATHRA